MEKYVLKFLWLLLIAFMPLSLTSCGDDEDEPDYDNGEIVESFGCLTVNNLAWTIDTSAPNYTSSNFCYWGSPKGSNALFLMLWDKDISHAKVGDNVTCDMSFPMEDCLYECTGGKITVQEVASKSITLNFSKVKYEYAGSYMGYAMSDRDKKYQTDNLTIDGTVEFVRN